MGKFQPGQKKPRNSGRRKGTPNKSTKDLLTLLHKNGIDLPALISETLPELSPEKRMDAILNLMNFVYPKRKAVEKIESEAEFDNKIQIEFVKPKPQLDY